MDGAEAGLLAKLEAILYASGRPISLTTLCSHLRLQNEREVSDLIALLVERYGQAGSPLEIKSLPEGRVVLQLRPEYTKQAAKVSMKPPLTAGPLKTLSYVAYNQPIEQKDVVVARGGQAYGHLKALENMGLIRRQRQGRTRLITTTLDFADYLGLDHDRVAMRRQLRSLFRSLEVSEKDKDKGAEPPRQGL
jgi:segregation and condensation protein B